MIMDWCDIHDAANYYPSKLKIESGEFVSSSSEESTVYGLLTVWWKFIYLFRICQYLIRK